MKEIIVKIIEYRKEAQRQKTIRKMADLVNDLIYHSGQNIKEPELSRVSEFILKFLNEIKAII